MKRVFVSAVLLLSLGQSVIAGENTAINMQWEQSMPKRCVQQRQSRFDPSIVEKAEAGDHDAQYELGLALFLGRGLPKDPDQALPWLERAANAGHKQSQLVLGTLFLHGWGKDSQHEKASFWYEKAAAQGSEEAKMALALLYWQGEEVEQNRSKAKLIMTELANNNYAPAQAMLGKWLLADANGNAEKLDQATYWFERAAANGSDEGQYALILTQINTKPHVSLDQNKMMWLIEGANQGDVSRQYLLGIMYRYGAGVRQNLALAKAWLTKAAKAGNNSAQVVLGTLDA